MKRHSRLLAGFFLFAALLAARLCHLDILWIEECYPAAGALRMLAGQTMYRDFRFDKPPLSAAVYLLWGAQSGWPLRLAGALFCLAACLLIWRMARDAWSEREGALAAGLLGFFLIFDTPSAVMALAPDLLMLLPHIAAIWLAWRGRAFWSGAAAGAAFLVNPKALFVLAACALWAGRSTPLLLAGFLVPNAAAVAVLFARGALDAYWQQVWQWGFLYARSAYYDAPFQAGVAKTLHWAGFHGALVAGAAWYLFRSEEHAERMRLLGWAALSLAAVAGGFRFFPRYYFQLLPVAAILAARGFAMLGRRAWLPALLLLVPLIRFGPRYVVLASDLLHGRPHAWADLALSEDSRKTAALMKTLAKPGDTLLVWGYRPDIFVWTRMPAGTPYLDSQPLTGVIADRHLTRTDPAAPALAARNRLALAGMHPDFVVDGLGPLNPALAIANYPELHAWLAGYRESGRTHSTILYSRLPRRGEP